MNNLDKLSLMIKDLLESQGFIQGVGSNPHQVSFELLIKDYHQPGNTTVYEEDIYTIDIKRKDISNV